ncbi:MAG: ATPase, T2SS/T4P/T4SS family [Candidatus Omnitrophota bacterium]
MTEERKNLEKILLEDKLISPERLNLAKEEAKKNAVSLEKILIKQGVVNNEQIATIIAGEMGIPFIDVSDYAIDKEVLKLIPKDLASKYTLIPLFKVGSSLTIAMADPSDIVAIDEVHLKSKCDIDAVLGIAGAITNAIDTYYGVKGDIEHIVEDISEEDVNKMVEKLKESQDTKDSSQLAEEAPLIRLVNLLIVQAVKERASDIHIEPDDKQLRVRFRIDGVLYERPSPPQFLTNGIISRVKILSKMDIAEKRKPQDGGFGIKVGKKDIDLRVSTYPTIYGENVVMRLLDKSSLLMGLEDLGLSDQALKTFSEMIRMPYGIILVTGPTGSGKTTTLYATLQTINTVSKNIITLEDPVEYRLPLIRQAQVNPKAGLTFASGLRSILRQDPNVIMVGEIRDLETVEIAVHAALTGQLVFSTLHTNDAPGAITRMIDMGVEPFLIASSVIGVVAQRLVRVLCPDCKEAYKPSEQLLSSLGLAPGKDYKFFKARSCRHCYQMGYKGRIGIYEVMVMNEALRKLAISKASSDEVMREARKSGLVSLREDGLLKAINGITSIEEVLRVTQMEV